MLLWCYLLGSREALGEAVYDHGMFVYALHEPVAVGTACQVQAVNSSHAPHLLRYSVSCLLTYSQSFLVSTGQLAAGASRPIICNLTQVGTLHQQQWGLAAHLLAP